MEIRFKFSGEDPEKLTREATKALRKAQRALGRDIAKVARRAVLDDVRRSRRGGLKMMGGRLGARTRVTPRADRVDVSLAARPAGPWAIVEDGSVVHEIAPVKVKALHFNGIWAAHAFHPGTKGLHVWAGAEYALDRAVTPVIIDSYDQALGVT